MPSFHWPSTSIHENMWNSKSCPEGLPHRKNGAMASRQAPANSNAREIGFLGKWPLAYLKPLISRRDAACRVSKPWSAGRPRPAGQARRPSLLPSSETGQAPISTGRRACGERRAILLHRKILGKLTGAKSFRRVSRGIVRSIDGTDHRGLCRHQRRGVDLVPGFYWISFLGSRARLGKCLLGDVHGLTLRRSALALEFGEKRFFLQRISGPQQFQERILGVGSVAAGLVEVDGVGDERTRGSFQLRSSAGPAGKEFDEVADALALPF